jgi:hypothetical protein
LKASPITEHGDFILRPDQLAGLRSAIIHTIGTGAHGDFSTLMCGYGRAKRSVGDSVGGDVAVDIVAAGQATAEAGGIAEVIDSAMASSTSGVEHSASSSPWHTGNWQCRSPARCCRGWDPGLGHRERASV